MAKNCPQCDRLGHFNFRSDMNFFFQILFLIGVCSSELHKFKFCPNSLRVARFGQKMPSAKSLDFVQIQNYAFYLLPNVMMAATKLI